MATQNLSAIIWSVADILRGHYKQADYGKIILPFTLLRRLDCTLEATKAAVLKEVEAHKAQGKTAPNALLERAAGFKFFNTSKLDMTKLLADPENIRQNLLSYIQSFSSNVGDVFERFGFDKHIVDLDSSGILYQVTSKFAAVDLHPAAVTNMDMGYAFEELIRRFAELSNETAGEHFTPREVIRLLVNLLFNSDRDALTKPGIIRSFYDPTAGTGGILSVADEYLKEMNPQARIILHGQELNPESFAICKADMLIKGQDVSKIKFGNTLTEDGFAGEHFDYCGANPPYGVDWKMIEQSINNEHTSLGKNGRFGAGLPRVSDGSLLFVQHLLSKMRPTKVKDNEVEGGGRIAIVLNGSPLFTGGAGSGESEIRRWIIESDYLEAIVALPTDLFYNTGISTYIWVMTNNKAPERKGKIQLIDASGMWVKRQKSLGSKRKDISDDQIAEITKLYGNFEESENSKIFNGVDFGYYTITVERPLRLNFAITPERIELLKDAKPLKAVQEAVASTLTGMISETVWKNREVFSKHLKTSLKTAGLDLSAPQFKAVLNALSERDETAELCRDAKGRPEADPDLRDTENIELTDDVDAYFAREVLTHIPDAWIEKDKTKVGYEIPFTKHFYKYQPPRELHSIDVELKQVTSEILAILNEVAA